MDAKSYKGSKHAKALEDAINLLRLPPAPFPPPDVSRKKLVNALSMKIAFAAALADAEQECYDWESALCQVIGEKEVQKIFQEHGEVDIDEADTVRGQYMTAVVRIRMEDYCMSRKGPVPHVGSSPNSHQ
ncbi:hypothetical protein JVT61DRAFT_6287 [Boletus reticuloceps]|uniref:Uncharacterized protein n=1 Tax=Boletus reticuloceps TaxID=495285 RepID=A0A8I3A880_9AGAM|nr:hypothetical protein JVT61DRAFT_6287 [Boletus reticuloceps]